MIIAIVLALIAIDQFTKYLAVQHLMDGTVIEIIPNFFRLLYVENRGAAFGVLQDSRLFFILITFLVLGVIFYFLFMKKDSVKGIYRLGLVLILSGTIGNFIDRIRLSYVIDFLSFRFFGYNFAVFNIADSLIVVGTFLLIIKILMSDTSHEK
ncbi:signal peptidase II [Peptoniphilus sp. KCTC 25270]|uniref:signal peptidase II n=1 Tax=Peptoniphilus sp. KCTC 25270 TaxID=2897414 RepID=UPI001E64704A|nr:signal peptidase II [Peptoniphilus sp. KCTC 25270]MCD1146968.1 signal peptidase II [Peptoniphilus sp. KCTC 25270]